MQASQPWLALWRCWVDRRCCFQQQLCNDEVFVDPISHNPTVLFAIADVDVMLGFDSIEPYMDGTSEYFGCIVGRVANRIKDATFTVGGQIYNLPANNNSNMLHGGKMGYDKVLWQSQVLKESESPSVQFTYHSADGEQGGEMGYDKVLWQSQVLKESESPSVQFTYHSADGEQGFPGELDVSATYMLHENELRLEMKAIPINKATPVCLAQHSYWNLACHNSGDILNHTLRIWGSHYTPVDDLQIRTGEIVPVAGTIFDFLKDSRIGSRIAEVPGGYDHNYVLDASDKEGDLHFAARLRDPSSGLTMDILTDAPGVQFYTGNFLVAVPGKGGHVYRKHAGLCLETQGFPNAVNEPKFPKMLVLPGEVYKHVMAYRFYKENDTTTHEN